MWGRTQPIQYCRQVSINILILIKQYYKNQEPMSSLPDIMKTIARRQLSQSAAQQGPTHPDQHTSQSPIQQDSINDTLSITNPQPIESVNSSQSNESQSSDLANMAEVKQYFANSQYQKLKLLYPTFQEKQIRSVAQQSWDTMSKKEKQIYYQKWVEATAQENKLMDNNLEKKVRNQEVLGISANQDSQKADEVQQANNQSSLRLENQRREEEAEVSIPENEAIQITTQSEGDGRSNAETNTSSVLNDQSNHTALPLIYTLVECEKSNSDESVPNNSNKASISSLGSSKIQITENEAILDDPEQSKATTCRIDLNLEQSEFVKKDNDEKLRE